MTGRGIFAGAALFFSAVIATAALALPPEQETEHVVESGETLNGIANRAKVSRDQIISANKLKPPYIVRIGQKLAIPRTTQGTTRTAAPAASPSLSAAASHVVQPGETLGGIANRANIPRILISEANGLKPPYELKAGQKLLLPRTRHHIVEEGETGFGIAYEYGVPWADIAVANGMDEGDPVRTGQKLLIPTVLDTPKSAPAASTAAASGANSRFIWPLEGTIRREFEPRGAVNYHDGIDIVAPRGSAVRATAAGKVVFAREEPKQFGNVVIIDHGGGWFSAYASLSRITVKKGHTVTRGERVGLVGDTSITRRTELHFELRKDAKPVDPMSELPKRQ